MSFPCKGIEPANPAICPGPCAWRIAFPQAWKHRSLMRWTTLRRKKQFKSLDIFLAPFTKYLLWPPVIGDQGAQSLCFMHNKELGIDLYCSAGMRERVRQTLPVPGRSTVALLDWRILQSNGVVREGTVPPGTPGQGQLAGTSQGHTCG
jgi:hypothetical protein